MIDESDIKMRLRKVIFLQTKILLLESAIATNKVWQAV